MGTIIQTFMICGTLLVLAFLVLLSMPKSQLRFFLLEILGWTGAALAGLYVQEIAGLSNEELVRNWRAYKLTPAIGEAVGFEKARDQSAGENTGRENDNPTTLRDQLFAPTPPTPTPEPEHPHERQHKR